MSKLSNEYLKIIEDIEKHISNKEESKYVTKKIGELTALYMDLIEKSINANLDRIEEIEEQLDKVQETVSLIKKDIYEDEDYDFEIVCPYCNHEFVADVEDELKEEIECPECHNIIELDWSGDLDDEHLGCNGGCSSCHGCGFDEIDEETDIDDDM